jgi:hypothetical protein
VRVMAIESPPTARSVAPVHGRNEGCHDTRPESTARPTNEAQARTRSLHEIESLFDPGGSSVGLPESVHRTDSFPNKKLTGLSAHTGGSLLATQPITRCGNKQEHPRCIFGVRIRLHAAPGQQQGEGVRGDRNGTGRRCSQNAGSSEHNYQRVTEERETVMAWGTGKGGDSGGGRHSGKKDPGTSKPNPDTQNSKPDPKHKGDQSK